MEKRRRLARQISNLAAPPQMALPIYFLAAWYDYDHHSPAVPAFLLAIAAAVFFGGVFPIIFVLAMLSRHQVTDIFISVRQQRTIPYLVTIFGFLAGFGAVYGLIGPSALAAIMFTNALTTVVLTIINLYWKMSGHAIGVAGPVAVLTVFYGWVAAPFYLLIPVVSWARVTIKAHTPGQVIAGSIFGYGFTLAQLLIIFRPLGWL
ncbi:MAG TPA: hypothetical protein VH186_25600 [Chloroflexia bacterium]|nr:hypothetical protein [Chloroflexia bacterium]